MKAQKVNLRMAFGLGAALLLVGCDEKDPYERVEYPPVVVEGTVLDSASLAMLSEVEIWHGSITVGETDSLGRYHVLDGMTPAGVMIFRKSGYRTDSLRLPEDFVRSPTDSYLYHRDVLMVRLSR
jgi:hypothetical protein